ncbi:MAG: hypothetical protein Q4F88_01570 [Eubacteriales bacterium]|nr:hypothetical protein [Eubacteriales bacterium]
MEENISFHKGKVEKKVSDEIIKSELAQYLQLDNLNFLIGQVVQATYLKVKNVEFLV